MEDPLEDIPDEYRRRFAPPPPAAAAAAAASAAAAAAAPPPAPPVPLLSRWWPRARPPRSELVQSSPEDTQCDPDDILKLYLLGSM